ncbi:MAG TPA: hypothetical protein VHO50_07430 [Bacteroidales bacterium]|nr:hypothetical protein [Bacteroidales bacterium]
MKLTKPYSLFAILFLCLAELSGQSVPHPIANTGVYDFIDELANMRIIEVNSAIKPYSRLFIAQKLEEADKQREKLSARQQKELDFYLLDFGKEFNYPKEKRRKDLFYYSDSLFSITVNPILGGELFYNASGKATYVRNGAEARGYVKNWGFYASLRDNHEKPLLGRPLYLTKRDGGHIKGGTDWSDMQGGITYDWSWGNAGLIKEKLQWGNSYNGSNIFGGNNPSFVQFRLQINPVKWFSFNYFHGFLNSMVVDSADSYWVNNSYGTDYREVYHRKYIAANMFTLTPLPGLNISLGNSIIYSDENINPAYIIPVFFYKSLDHSLTSGIDNMNSQMYLDVSSRQIKHLHLYGTLFIDELSADRFTMDDEWNFFSWKTGFRITDLPIPNLSFTGEFTYTYPLTFQHYVSTLTFETAGFNLGHYMKDNSREYYFALDYRPLRTLNINLFFVDAARGPDYTELGGSRLGNPPLDTIQWSNRSIGLKADFQVINDVYVWFSAVHSETAGDVRWNPPFLAGKKDTYNFGMTVGF